MIDDMEKNHSSDYATQGSVEKILSTLKTVRGQYKDKANQGDAYLETLDYDYINRHGNLMNTQVVTAMDQAIQDAVNGAAELFVFKATLMIGKASQFTSVSGKNLSSKTDEFIRVIQSNPNASKQGAGGAGAVSDLTSNLTGKKVYTGTSKDLKPGKSHDVVKKMFEELGDSCRKTNGQCANVSSIV